MYIYNNIIASMPNFHEFDEVYYLKHNPDLQALVKSQPKCQHKVILHKHFITYGIKENRDYRYVFTSNKTSSYDIQWIDIDIDADA